MRTAHIIKVIVAGAIIAFAIAVCMSYLVIIGPADNRMMGVVGGTLFHIFIVCMLLAFIIWCLSWFFFDDEEPLKNGTKCNGSDKIVITYKEDTDVNGKKVIEGEVKLVTECDDDNVCDTNLKKSR